MTKIIWKEIEEAPDYMVSNRGEILSNRTSKEKMMKTFKELIEEIANVAGPISSTNIAGLGEDPPIKQCGRTGGKCEEKIMKRCNVFSLHYVYLVRHVPQHQTL